MKTFSTKYTAKDLTKHVLCEIAETSECLHNWFRAGSAHTSNGAVEFLKECHERIPPRVDSGFFDGDLLDFLESRQSE